MTYLIILLTLFIPYFVKLLSRKIKLFRMLAPIITVYLLGFLFGNLLGNEQINAKVHQVIGVLLILSIPPLLYKVNLKRWIATAPQMVKAFLLLIFSLFLTTGITYILFKDVENINQLLGMSIATASGGLANTNAVALIIGVNPELLSFMIVSIFIAGGIQLLLIMGPAPKLLKPFFTSYKKNSDIVRPDKKYVQYSAAQRLKSIFILLLISLIILGLCVGTSLLVFNKINGSFAILLATTIGILASFSNKAKNIPLSFEFGEYLVLIFCFQMAFITNFKQFLTTDKSIILMVSFFYLLSTIIHFVLCYFFKIDRDTTIMVNAAGIQGPPMIGVIAQSLKNRELIVGGLLTSIVGIGVANYLGTIVFNILK